MHEPLQPPRRVRRPVQCWLVVPVVGRLDGMAAFVRLGERTNRRLLGRVTLGSPDARESNCDREDLLREAGTAGVLGVAARRRPRIGARPARARGVRVTSFATDIAPLFRPRDVRAMKSRLDLSSHTDVKNNAQAVLQTVTEHSMPCDRPWPNERVALLRTWIAEGCPA